MDIGSVIAAFAEKLPARIRDAAIKSGSPLFPSVTMEDLGGLRAEMSETLRNLEFIAATVSRPKPSQQDRQRIKILEARGLSETLRRLYPGFQLVELFGTSVPICTFPAPEDQWADLEAAVAGEARQRWIPRKDQYPSDFFPSGAEELRNIDNTLPRTTTTRRHMR